jgi:hypothetical protein
MPARQRLAAAVDRLLHAAANRTVPWRSAMPLKKSEIEDAYDELSELAERLREARPVPVHAVARVVMLLSDGTGPLYGRGTPGHAWALARTGDSRSTTRSPDRDPARASPVTGAALSRHARIGAGGERTRRLAVEPWMYRRSPMRACSIGMQNGCPPSRTPRGRPA